MHTEQDLLQTYQLPFYICFFFVFVSVRIQMLFLFKGNVIQYLHLDKMLYLHAALQLNSRLYRYCLLHEIEKTLILLTTMIIFIFIETCSIVYDDTHWFYIVQLLFYIQLHNVLYNMNSCFFFLNCSKSVKWELCGHWAIKFIAMDWEVNPLNIPQPHLLA